MIIGSITVTEMVEVLGTLYCMGGDEKVYTKKKKNLNFSRKFEEKNSLTNRPHQLNAERSAESLFNLLDVDNNGDINEEEFIRSNEQQLKVIRSSQLQLRS